MITLPAGAPPISMNYSGISTPLKPVLSASASATTGEKGQINTGKKGTKMCPNSSFTAWYAIFLDFQLLMKSEILNY